MVTGDHGIRTRLEDPDFSGGVINEYSFHVPLLVFAPSALSSRRDIPWITSHIGLSPTILDLLGVAWGRDWEQGSPIGDHRLSSRTTFFWANHYLGADGFCASGRYAMWNHVSDAVYASDHPHFDTNSSLVTDPRDRDAVIRTINRMVALQETWTRRMPIDDSPPTPSAVAAR